AEVLMTKEDEKAGSWLWCKSDDTVYDAAKQGSLLKEVHALLTKKEIIAYILDHNDIDDKLKFRLLAEGAPTEVIYKANDLRFFGNNIVDVISYDQLIEAYHMENGQRSLWMKEYTENYLLMVSQGTAIVYKTH
ncbi:hypothetical protein Tco_0778410, partial [Tanacetum coccineum]